MDKGSRFTFIDLFAGIGGMRIAFESAGGRCVFSSEWDRFARQTYFANFHEEPAGDLRSIPSEAVPYHDILLAGFPCQPFSISGVSKKRSLGRPHGFDDPTQGTLFFEVLRIIEAKRPSAFLLENVKNLRSHDGGRTYRVILDSLMALGYTVDDRVLDARHYVPQHRERIFIVGFAKPSRFTWPAVPSGPSPRLRTVLEHEVDEKYTLSNRLWSYLQAYAEKHRAKGNGFGFGLADREGVSRTLSARYYKDGSEILVPQAGGNPRRLTPRECARLMGFITDERDFVIPVSDTQAYKQFGNAVVVPLVEAIAEELATSLQLEEQDDEIGTAG